MRFAMPGVLVRVPMCRRGAAASVAELPSERLFREYAARAWQTEGTDYCVIGQNAATWDRYDESRRFRGRDDGKMRVELDASQFRYIPMNKRASTVSAERFADKVEAVMVDAAEAAFAVRDRGLKAMNDTFDKVLDSHVPEVYSRKGVIQEYLMMADSFDRAEVVRLIHQHKPYDIKADLSRTWMLEDMLKADELYEAYPQLRSVLVQEEGMRNFLVLGAADEFKIILNANRLARFISNPRKVLLHEVQHLVQNIEKFAQGSNPNISYQDFQTEHKRIKKEVELLRRRSDADAGVLEEAGRKLAAFDKVERKYKGNRSGLEKLLHSATLGLFPRLYSDVDLYNFSAGEAEARNVETRANWSARKRNRKPFNDTLAVPAEYTVVKTLSQRTEGTQVLFSVIGPNAKTWDKYRDRMFTGRDDGMLRADIDASQARYNESAFDSKATVAFRKILLDSFWEEHKILTTEEDHAIQDYAKALKDKKDAELKLIMANGIDVMGTHQESYNEARKRAALLRLPAYTALEKAFETQGVESITKRVEGRFMDEIAIDFVERADRESDEVYKTLQGIDGALYLPLSEVLHYPELYEAYPQLAEMKRS